MSHPNPSHDRENERIEDSKYAPRRKAKSIAIKNITHKALNVALARRKSGSIRYLGGEKPKHVDDYPND